MDAYVTPAHAGTRPERPHGEEEDYEKKPVLKKVKDKVKKIKNTISKKTHGHDRDHDHDHGHDTNSSEDEYEEEADPEVHGAPMYESAAAGNLKNGRDKIGQPERVDLGTILGRADEAPAADNSRSTPSAAYADPTRPTYPADDRTFLERSENRVQEPVTLGMITGRVEEDPAAPNSRSRTSAPSDHTQLISSTGSGSNVVGEPPIIRSFENMSVSDKPQGEKAVLQSPPTGTHDQFSPTDPPRRSEDGTEEHVQDAKAPTYTEKIVSTATAAKEAAASAASTVYNKVAEAGTAITAKAQPQGAPTGTSVKGYLSEKLRPGEEDRALSEVISDAMHAKRPAVTESHATEGEGGKGMVDKIKGAVTSLLGAESVSGNRVPSATDDRMEGAEGRAEQVGGALREGHVNH